ncbi:MAG TPA: MFS transporter [Vicinamibacteria bacterium]|nr:MFS transporter [Vicinamibacteria bacterium]
MTPRRLLAGLAFAAFISLGLPDGLLGVAWPSIRRTFDLPLSQLGSLLALIMAGYLSSSFLSGTLVGRWGVGRLLLWSNVTMVVSCVGYALAPHWGVMLVCGLLAGLGAGAIDAGINAYTAAHFPPRVMSWLHGSWGLGAALGPLVMTTVLTAGLAWRWGYAVVAVALAAMALAFARTRDWWDAAAAVRSAAPVVPPAMAGIGETLARPAVWLHLAFFFLYTGLEASAGQWAYSILTEARGRAPASAGIWVGAYWGSLTLGRFACGLIAPRVSTDALLRLCTLVAPLGAGLFWFGRGAPALAGLCLLGFILAPIFPLTISATPGRLGSGFAAHAIGFQVSAACVGGAALPAAGGLIARRYGLEAITTFQLAVALVLLVLHEGVLAAGARGKLATGNDR